MDNQLRNRLIKWSPVIVFATWILAMHFVMTLGFADDYYFKSYTQVDGFTITGWLYQRYMTWSSRTLIEGSLIISMLLPFWVWRVLDSALLVLTAWTISYLFVRDEKRLQGNILICAMMSLIWYDPMASSGWMSSTINYVWPLAAALIAAIPIKRYLERDVKGDMKPWEYIVYTVAAIYAANAEQLCALLFLTYVAFVIYVFVKEHRIHTYGIVMVLLQVVGLANVALCPGNANRITEETPRWFPQYAEYTIFEKLSVCISSTMRYLFSDTTVVFWGVTIMVALFTTMKSVKIWRKIMGVIPMLITMGTYSLQYVMGEKLYLYRVNDAYNYVFDGFGSWKQLVILGGDLLAILVLLVDIVILVEHMEQGLLIAGLVLLGCASKAMVGLSSTVWASYERTGWVSNFMMICAMALLYRCVDMDKSWQRKVMNVVMAILVAFMVYGMYYNYATTFLVRA